jgi:1-acyl-sn-glycerol-3-phosphate acyltransferase
MKYVALNPAVPPLDPSINALRRFEWMMKIAGPLGRFGFRRFIKKMEVQGGEHLQGGPKLILMNHSSPLDPLLLTFYGNQLFQFLITEPYMADRKLARFAAWVGQIPKRKLEPDTRAIRTMKKWGNFGGNVATFPEGQFSWDGYPLPLQPGLGELVKYLNVPVVMVRLINGDRLWPAWATHPRKTSLRLEVEAPHVFAENESSAAIEDYVTRHLEVNPETCARWPVEGKNLAAGLARFLRYCFVCAADHALVEQDDELRCEACLRTWRVSAENELHFLSSPQATEIGSKLTIARVWALTRALLQKNWSTSVLFLKSEGAVEILDASSAQWSLIEKGELTLEGSSITLGPWQLEVKNILAHTMDWGDLILIRTERKRWALRFPKDSRAIWTFALDEAIAQQKVFLKTGAPDAV